jgi:hypothetical protein
MVTGLSLCPATSQRARQHRIAGGLPSDDISREGSVHRFSSRERDINISVRRSPRDTENPESL